MSKHDVQSRLRPHFLIRMLAIIVVLLGLSTSIAFALHGSNLLELDGNAADSPVGAPYDWVNVWNKDEGAGTPDNALISLFIHDGPDADTPDDNTHFTEGSKDDLDIPGWAWSANDTTPDKNDILNAYAAAFNNVDGDLVLFFGLDRLANNGSSNIGFWFFRNPVSLVGGPTSGTFSGVHSVGDLLVVSEFSGGGSVDSVLVYEWVGPGNGDSGSGNALLNLTPTAGQDCRNLAANPDDKVCGMVNNEDTFLPWPFESKNNRGLDPGTNAPPDSFFEGALNVSELLFGVEGGDTGCFAGFLANTRSSFSLDASLKDFALGAFDLCDIAVTKAGDTLSKIGDPVNYTVTIQNTGSATLYKRDISDTVLGVITDEGLNVANANVVSNTCGASLTGDDGAPGGTDECTITLLRTVLAGDPDPLPNTVTILYSERADFTGAEFTRTDDHTVNLFQPAVTIDKTGDGLSKIGDPVNYTFTITNESSEDSPDLTLASISDNVIGDLSADATTAGCDTLTFGEECSFSIQRTVLEADDDPLVNTVDVHYNPVGFPNDITFSDGHSVNLFQPDVSITKDGDGLSKIGDDVTYTIRITNSGSADSPNLVLDSISDDVLGNLSDEAPAACDSIAPAGFCEFDVPWTVAAVDVNPADGQADDPVINTVTIHFHPAGFPNDITATASHELNLFQPSIGFSKSADTELSKATDDVNYTIALNNTSSADSPDLDCTITDAKLGVDKDVTLASGEGDVTNIAYTVLAGDSDPLVNTASVRCSPQGFPNVLSASDSWTVNLFQPSVTVDKTGDALSKIGDEVTYHFVINNTSSGDSPNLMLDEINDDVLGGLTATGESNGCDNLAAGDSCEFDVLWTVLAGFGDPVVNTVDVLYHPVGFPNDITDTDSHSLNLFQPSLTFSKTADTQLSKVGDDVNYTITLNNTSSADSPALECTITDLLLGLDKDVTLAPGGSDVTNIAYTVQASDPDPLDNTASVLCRPAGFPNELTGSGSWTVNLFQPAVTIDKTGDELSKIGDPVNYTFTITNASSEDSPDLTLASISDSVIGDLSSQANAAGCDTLTYGEVCFFSLDRTVQGGDPDPLVNTVNVLYHPVGFLNDITASDGHSVNLFNPAVSIEKTGNGLSKIGDSVTYHFSVTNTGSDDSPNLVLDSISDDVLGDLATYASAAGCDSLAPGASCEFDVPWTVAAVDIQPANGEADDPVINTVTIHFHPDGFENDITATASHELNLFQPSIAFAKTADTELSKATDDVNYTITLNNTSSTDTPALVCTITDAKLGVNKTVTLASGAGDVTDIAYTVQANDLDPLVNTASVTCSPVGFPNVLATSDSWTVNLFQPSLTVTKTGPAYSKAGDTATYNVTIANTSSADSPDLVLDSFSDSVAGSVVPPAECNTLASGASCSFDYDYVVQAGDPDPLVNTATAHYHPSGFTNDISNSGSYSTALLHPSFTVTKVCKAQPVSQAGPAVFTITFNNTGDADLHVVPSEGVAFDVAAGASHSYDYSIPGPFSASVNNTVTGVVTLDPAYGLDNSYDFSASATCSVYAKAKIVKTVSGQPPAAGQTYTFELRQGASTASDGTILETKTTDASGAINFTTNLTPGATYQICEWVFPGWNTSLAGDGPLFVPNSIIPPSLPNPNVNNLTVCADFTVTSGQTRTFTVDNTPPPGGRALTIGFWKNWASCANSQGKGQDPMLDLALGYATAMTLNPPDGLVVSAQNANGGWPTYALTYYLVLKGNPASTADNILVAPDCLPAVRLLDKSRIDNNRKQASDPLFNMTAQLVGAELNRFMGAGINGATIMNIDRAVLLNGKYSFNGSTYSPRLTTADRNLANCLATQLDRYNNNLTVSTCP